MIKILFYIWMLVFMLGSHELVHYQIWGYYGCDSIEAGITWKGAYVSADMGSCKTEGVMLPHSINDLVGYSIMPLLLVIIVMLGEQKGKS